MGFGRVLKEFVIWLGSWGDYPEGREMLATSALFKPHWRFCLNYNAEAQRYLVT
jgi:hypothetical protein